MSKPILLYLLLLSVCLTSCTSNVANRDAVAPVVVEAKTDTSFVIELINDFRLQKRDLIADKVVFPLHREFPLPSIKNKQELLKCFADLFDEELTSLIVNSDIRKDWSEMGSGKMMLRDGELWLDETGRIIAVNHISKSERQKLQVLIEKDRLQVHSSLKSYSKPVLTISTKEYFIRIDEMKDESYRFASWKKGQNMSSKPELIIENGHRDYEGSGGNHYYTFENKEYTYVVGIQVVGLEDIPGELTILKGGQEVLVQQIESLQY